MADKLAGLALPDGTHSEDESDLSPAAGDRPAHRRRLWPLPPRHFQNLLSKQVGSRDDWLVIAGGVGLAAACALFPWYIFFNQESFGVRPLRFAGRADAAGIGPETLPELVGVRMMGQKIDFSTTGAIGEAAGKAPRLQPFPGDLLEFRLIQAGNGRAMIADKDGFWIVQRGSPLPDGSTVTAIERHKERWVLVTSLDDVIPATGG